MLPCAMLIVLAAGTAGLETGSSANSKDELETPAAILRLPPGLEAVVGTGDYVVSCGAPVKSVVQCNVRGKSALEGECVVAIVTKTFSCARIDALPAPTSAVTRP